MGVMFSISKTILWCREVTHNFPKTSKQRGCCTESLLRNEGKVARLRGRAGPAGYKNSLTN